MIKKKIRPKIIIRSKLKKRKPHKITLRQIGQILTEMVSNTFKLNVQMHKLNENTIKLWAELYADVKIVKGIIDEKEKELLDSSPKNSETGMGKE